MSDKQKKKLVDDAFKEAVYTSESGLFPDLDEKNDAVEKPTDYTSDSNASDSQKDVDVTKEPKKSGYSSESKIFPQEFTNE